ncbi:MAG: hypothetical protein NT080_14230 [Spirochaetes bacterium]|nr:hypothetical protein [Spirochaetota bacterium]
MQRHPLALVILGSMLASGVRAQDAIPAVDAAGAPAAQLFHAIVALDLSGASPEALPAYIRGMQTTLTGSETAVSLAWFGESYAYGEATAERALRDAAVRSGCRFTVSCAARDEGPNATAIWTVRDIRMKIDYPEKQSAMKNPTTGSIVDFFWLGAVATLAEATRLAVPDEYITVLALPGSVVSGLTPKAVLVGDSGELIVPVIVPKPYNLVVEAKGYLPAKLRLLVDRPGMEVVVDQRPLPRFDFECALYQVQFPDFKFRYWIPHTRFFASAGFEQFLAGFLLVEDRGETATPAPPLWSGIPLVQPGIGGGMDLTPAGFPFECLVGADVFTRVFFPEWSGVALDPAATLGIRLYASAAQRLSGNALFFAQLGSIVYPIFDRDLILASKNSDSGPEFSVLAGPVFMEFMSFRCGLRWELR